MSDTASTIISRRHLLEAAGTAAAAVAALGLTSAGAATSPNPAPFQIAVKGPIPDVVTIPLDPPMLSGRPALKGQSSLLGQVAYADDHQARVGLDGNPIFGYGKGVHTGANGDALFVTWVELFPNPPSAAGLLEGTGAFIVTGGKGAFRGATGSGTLHIQLDYAMNQLTFTFDGMVATPKA